MHSIIGHPVLTYSLYVLVLKMRTKQTPTKKPAHKTGMNMIEFLYKPKRLVLPFANRIKTTRLLLYFTLLSADTTQIHGCLR